MRFCTFQVPTTSTTHFGAIDSEDTLTDLTTAVPGITTLLQALQTDPSLTVFKELLNEPHDYPTYHVNHVHLMSPILKPEKVLCVGMNYREHCEEQGFPIPAEPVIFNKFPSSLTGSSDNVYFNGTKTQQMDYEVELAVIVGQGGKDIDVGSALDHVAGVTVAHDVSSRDWQFQKNGGQWLLGKCQDSFCPLGPALVTLDEIPNVNHLRLTTRVNGTTMQDGNTSEFIFDVPEIIAWVSQFVTLVPGDIILTGTPSGVGCFRKPPVWLKHGDVVECSIEQLGTIRNVMVDVSKQGTSGEMNSSLAVSAVSAVEAIEKAVGKGYVPMYIGTYTENKGFVDGIGKGVYPCALNTTTGEMVLMGSPMITSNPTFICTSRDGNNLYTVSEDATINRGQLSGSTRSWNIGTKKGQGSGTMVSSWASGGTDSCYIEMSQAETFCFVSNYTSGSVAVFPVRPDRSLGPLCSFVQHETTKSLPGPVNDRQEGPHAHQARCWEASSSSSSTTTTTSSSSSAGPSWLYVPDLGLDCVVQYTVDDTTGALSECGRWETPLGGGPRHMDWSEQHDQYVYVTLEMGNAICVYQRNASTGGLETLLQTISSLPLDCELQYPENSTAQLLVHPSGRYVYVSNRGHDTIGCYRIETTGKLISVGWYSSHGLCPRNFCFSKDGALCIVANQNSHDLYTYRVNMETGELVDTGHSLSVPSPVCVCL